MGILQNLDLLTVGITVAGIVVLGFAVYLNNRKSATNTAFLLFSVSSALYSIVNYLSYQDYSLFSQNLEVRLWIIRATIFLAIWHAFLLFHFFYIFPLEKTILGKWYKGLLLPLVILCSILNLSPWVVGGLTSISGNQVSLPIFGPASALFGALSIFLIVAGLVILIKKTRRFRNVLRKQSRLILLGTIITHGLIIVGNLVLPTIFGVVTFVPFAPLFTIPFVVLTAYSILKHKLFNIKVMATAVLVFVLAVVTFLEIIFSDALGQVVFRSSVFLLVLIAGILLIRSVLREVKQRERIEELAKDLTASNDKLFVLNEKLHEIDKQKTEFVSIASHQLRSPLTAIKGYSSMLLEGSFGNMEEKVKGAVSVVFESSQKLVSVIEDFLNVTRIELGSMKYNMADFDFRQMTERVVKELQMTAWRDRQEINLNIGEGDYKMNGDEGKLTQVIHNLVDNAIKYSEEGPIEVNLSRVTTNPAGANETKSHFRLAIKDKGVGLAPEAIKRLFQKFGRGEHAGDVNAGGTGLGLFIAKQIVEAHNGRLWAESEGLGKGSTFIAEL
ncbi:MAG: ATP-binding protein [Patescibacteria group bacterium]|nr:ATP-binding protein [Patescibacteria group bacterium]